MRSRLFVLLDLAMMLYVSMEVKLKERNLIVIVTAQMAGLVPTVKKLNHALPVMAEMPAKMEVI